MTKLRYFTAPMLNAAFGINSKCSAWVVLTRNTELQRLMTLSPVEVRSVLVDTRETSAAKTIWTHMAGFWPVQEGGGFILFLDSDQHLAQKFAADFADLLEEVEG